MTEARNERRFGALRLDREAIIPILRGDCRLVEGLPDVCEVVNVSYDLMTNGWHIILVSPEFEPVPAGQIVPLLFPMYRIRVTNAPAATDRG